jgi:hypothetical protein
MGEITIDAPADLVLEVAGNFDLQSIPTVRAILWLRAKMLGARRPTMRPATGLVTEMVALGWRCLAEEPSR